MAADIALQLDANLTARLATCNGVRSDSAGQAFRLALRSGNRSAESAPSNGVYPFDSPASFQPIPWPASFGATLLYLRQLDGGPVLVRLEFETTPAVEVPLHGLMLLEFPVDDRCVLVELQGVGKIEWLAAGSIA